MKSKWKAVVVVTVGVFLTGLAIGSIRVPSFSPRSRGPIDIQFCSILQNPGVIGSARFLTTAAIASIQPHGMVLVSDRCPELAASFSEQLESEKLSKTISERLLSEPYKPVPITFEGSLTRIPLAERCWQVIASRFGVHADSPAPIIVRKYVRIDKPSQLLPTGGMP